MGQNLPTKHCRGCFLEIDARARKCPQCHTYQGKIVPVLASVGILIGVGLAGSMIWVDYWVHYKATYRDEDFSSGIDISGTRLFFTPRTEGNALTIVGRVTNRNGIPIERMDVEIQAFNKQDELIDSFYNSVSQRLNPGDEQTFRTMSYQPIHLDKSEYVSHKVLVRRAWSLK